MFGRVTITLGIGPHSSVAVIFAGRQAAFENDF